MDVKNSPRMVENWLPSCGGCHVPVDPRHRMARKRSLLAAVLDLGRSLSVRPGPPRHHAYSIGLP
jgi:hypothetical protein